MCTLNQEAEPPVTFGKEVNVVNSDKRKEEASGNGAIGWGKWRFERQIEQ
jgi:hypothetical protein